MASNIVITGSRGVIGTVLRRRLTVPIRQYDLPAHDLRDFQAFCDALYDCRAIIHLAWDQRVENARTSVIDPHNYLLTSNVLHAAVRKGVKRVILASSIHADMPVVEPGTPRSPLRLPEPDSGYGATKVASEALGRYFALRHGLEVICIRFGWVDKHDAGPPPKPYPAGEAWLSHRDCASLLQACIEAPATPNNYTILYGVSQRAKSAHSTKNPFGWKPQDSYAS